jgi:hypothetical protein
MNARAMVRGLAWDVGLPVVAYYALVLLGASDWVALLTGTCLAGVRVVWGVVRERALNPFAAVMLLVFGLGLALSFVTGDPRFLLLVKSLTTGVVGLFFLGTAALGRRPLTLAAQQSWSPDRAEELGREYAADPDVRRGHRFISTVWGLGLVGEALLRVVLVLLLPLDVAVGASSALLVVVIAGLVVWTGRWVARAQQRAREA